MKKTLLLILVILSLSLKSQTNNYTKSACITGKYFEFGNTSTTKVSLFIKELINNNVTGFKGGNGFFKETFKNGDIQTVKYSIYCNSDRITIDSRIIVDKKGKLKKELLNQK
ncbi:MAG: hypothetical protein E2590_01780 [Chryseobacterium sp.]|nr:hypothetical protein [Chryseobacterium sp.]